MGAVSPPPPAPLSTLQPFLLLYLHPGVFLHFFFDSPEHDEAALHCFFL